MNIKKISFILITLAIILGIIFAIFYFLGERDQQNGAQEGRDPFPVNIDSGFGSIPGEETPTNNSNQTPTTSQSPQIIPTLRKLSNEPTSGVYIYNTVREVTRILYNEEGAEEIEIVEIPETKFQIIERRNAHISEFNSLDLLGKKISDTTIVRVRETIAGVGGYVFRYLAEFNETILSYRGSLEIDISATEDGGAAALLKGSFLPENITSMTLSSDKESIAYIISEGGAGSILYTTPIDAFTPTQIATLPLSEIHVLWPSEQTFMFYTKSDSRIPGNLLTLGASGELQTTLSEMYGLTVNPSPSRNIVFVSFDVRGDIITAAINLDTGFTSNITGVRTIASDKCVWSTVEENIIYCGGTRGMIRGDYPENWYSGSRFFVDTLWQINTETGDSEIISYLDEDNVTIPFDIIQPTLAEGDTYLLFINKYDRAPWVLNLGRIINPEDEVFLESGAQTEILEVSETVESI